MDKDYEIRIPNRLMRDRNLSFSAKVLYIEIVKLCGDTGQCHATNAKLGELLGVSTRSITELIKDLKRFQYIDTFNIEETYTRRPIRVISLI